MFYFVQALKAIAFQRLSKRDQAIAVLDEVFARQPTAEQTLSTMEMAYKALAMRM